MGTVAGTQRGGVEALSWPPVLRDSQFITFLGGDFPQPLALRTSGVIKVRKDTAGGSIVTVSMPSGDGHLLIAFAKNEPRLTELTTLNPDVSRKAVDDHYWDLLRNRIETPDRNLNALWRGHSYTGILLDCTLWLERMHSPLAGTVAYAANRRGQWLGQVDRSRTCTLTHAHMLFPNGAVPQLRPDGNTHRDFGGSNQFWAWQVRHYLKFTGDKEFARE